MINLRFPHLIHLIFWIFWMKSPCRLHLSHFFYFGIWITLLSQVSSLWSPLPLSKGVASRPFYWHRWKGSNSPQISKLPWWSNTHNSWFLPSPEQIKWSSWPEDTHFANILSGWSDKPETCQRHRDVLKNSDCSGKECHLVG